MKDSTPSSQASQAAIEEVEKGGSSHNTSSSSPWSRLSRRRQLIYISLAIMGILALALGLGLGLGLTRAAPSPQASKPTSSAAAVVRPSVGDTWDYPLGVDITLDNVEDDIKFYSVDLEYTDEETIRGLIARGHYIACYFSAGSWEEYRSDLGSVPESALGNVLDGWDDERWFDTRNSAVRNVMTTRISQAAENGCQGIDPDNLDGHTNDPGFDLTEDDAVDYIEFLAKEAHDRGLAFGLKNGGDFVPRVVNVSDWVVNEQCAQYTECEKYAPFIEQDKAVFHVEYLKPDDATTVPADFREKSCNAEGAEGFSSIIKHEPLDDGFRVVC